MIILNKIISFYYREYKLKGRMSGWQLDAFLKSYDNKIKEGVSLFKKGLKWVSQQQLLSFMY